MAEHGRAASILTARMPTEATVPTENMTATADFSDAYRAAPRKVVIKPTQGWASLRIGELWTYRELLYFLIWRDLKVRYRQTAFGVAWVVLQPLILMTVIVLFFGLVVDV